MSPLSLAANTNVTKLPDGDLDQRCQGQRNTDCATEIYFEFWKPCLFTCYTLTTT